MQNRARLIEWIDTLSIDEIKKVLSITIEELIEAETIRFPDWREAPYWEASGERIDEKE